MSAIDTIHAREILDSRGYPTVEAEVTLADGTTARASVPSGASTGTSEALELRDGEPRFAGRGVRRAVENVRSEIAPRLRGMEAADQVALDQAMIALDSTPAKSRLGANGILAVSLATARAAAHSSRLPLWRHLNEALFPGVEPALPMPMVNILSGGHHAGFQLDIQDLLVIPIAAASTGECLEWLSAIYFAVRDILRRECGYTQLVADEGGFGPRLHGNEAMLEVVCRGVEAAGLRLRSQVVLAIDVASTHFHRDGTYRLAADGVERDAEAMIEVLERWTSEYPVISIEDGLSEDDWAGWQVLTGRLGATAQLLGDDLFTTSPERLRRGIGLGAANSVPIKVNQIGTLAEAAEALTIARESGYSAVVSTRSGETCDDAVVDLAVASGAGQIKPGSVARSERLAKFNQMLRLEEELGTGAFRGAVSLRRWWRPA